MDRATAASRLRALWGEIRDLESTSDLLEWDQETNLPAGGQPDRAAVMATLAALRHRKLNAPELREVLAACAEHAAAEGDDLLAAQVRMARRDVDRAVRVPEELARTLAAARSDGLAAWQGARSAADFSLFAPALERLVSAKRQEAAAVRPGGPVYDTLLDEFEPAMTEEQLAPLFASLQQALAPLVRSVAAAGGAVDEAAVRGRFPAASQRAFGVAVVEAIGFDWRRGRLDPSAHPFCVGVHPTDVRLTWRWEEDDFRPGFYAIVHEAGHGLYEQGLPRPLDRTPVGQAVSLGVHESQSRLWENHVGRSRGFWRWALPRLHATFPDTSGVGVDDLWPALHLVKPSLIRVEADEVTYNLHVAVRFEIERALFAGRLEVAELPAAWNELYGQLLGLTPADDAEGVLQDIHWSQGMFGYFPTYTLGNMAAAQLFAAAERHLGDLDEAFAAGDFGGLLGWLRQHVHRHGARFAAAELIERATGRPLAADDLLAHLRRTVAGVYGAPA